MTINTEEIRWASEDVNAPISGNPNKVEPPTSFKNEGLSEGEPLGRNYLNYQLNKYHEMFTDIQAQIDALVVNDVGSAILQQIFHVGAYYFSASNQNPSVRFGFGTWQQVEGKFIVGVDSDDTDFDAAGKTGGSKNHTHGNTFTTDEAGEHGHDVPRDGWGSIQDGTTIQEPSIEGRLVTGSGDVERGEDLSVIAHAADDNATSSAGAHTHEILGDVSSASNLPPFESAYIWKRTA